MARAATLIVALHILGCAGVSPVEKVVELLEENKGKIAADLAAEEKEMAEFSTYCDDELTAKGFSIKTATSEIAKLEAAVEDGKAEIEALQAEVTSVGSEMAAKEQQLSSESVVRSKGKDAFEKTQAELLTSVDELEGALSTLKQGQSFLQASSGRRPSAASRKKISAALEAISRIVDASTVNTQQKRALQGLIQTAQGEGDNDLSLNQVAPPKAAAFESSTGAITEKIEEMKEKAEESLSDARNTEVKAQHTFDMMAQSLTDAIKVNKEKLAAAQSGIARATEAMGAASGELVETQKVKASDEAFVQSLSHECTEAKEAWAARQESAKEEMAVIEKAKGILVDRVKVFVQVSGKVAARRAASIDDQSDSAREAALRGRVVEQLRSLSRRYRSYALMEMVSAATADPFVKIRGLIEDMIAKLVEEANQEATQKAFCDEEIGKSNTAKEDKTMKLEKTQSRLDKAAATKAELEDNVKELEAEIAELDAGSAEATKIRGEEHATYQKESKDFKDAAEAVSEAITLLKEYYEGASLIQAPSFGGAKGDAAHSIISILEMSGEDFEKLYMEVEQEEAEAAAAYKKLTEENTVSKTAKAAEVKGALSEIKSLEVAIKDNGEDVETITAELDAILGYLDKLKPQCETKAMSYAEKKARREAEIEGLKEALTILEG